MAVALESKVAYYRIRNKLGPMQLRVLRVIENNGPISNQEIAQELDLPINHITGRTNELYHKGLVVADKRVLATSGIYVKAWEVVKLGE